MKSSNPNSGCREVDVAKCIDTTYPDPSKNQGGVCVVQPCAAFMGGQGAKAGSIAYGENVSPTLKSTLSGGNTIPTLVAFNQNADGEVRVSKDTAFALSTNGNASGRNSPVIALQANGIDRADTAGCNGAGWREDQSYTLNTVDRHAVCYPDVARTLERRYDSSPCVDRGQETVVQCYPEIASTIAASGAGTSRPAGQGNETDFCVVLGIGKDHTGTLMANASTKQWLGNQEAFSGDYAILEPNGKKYIVRRLMPIETLRLQGYPDWWHDLAPFDGDVDFWESVRKAWAEINGKQYRPFKSVEQLEKWYNGLRTDAAEYKADGNSLAIPCAAYVMRRIKEFAE